MFIDETILEIKTGQGGDGSKSIHREKFLVRGKPDGGDGGQGGHVYFQSFSSLHTLYDIQLNRFIKTDSGEQGQPNRQHGKNGKDICIHVPIGTRITELYSDKFIADFGKDQEKILIASGGLGGKGNMNFKSSQNKGTTKITLGKIGVKLKLKLELQLIADCGLVGFPNVGKSSLIQRLTNSQSKIGSYPFTTLQPFLGVVQHSYGSFVLADIPGLIKGAAQGKGLGNQFLKHIERCHCLVFVVDSSQDSIWEDYQSLLHELKSFQPELVQRPKIILTNKVDLGKPRIKPEWKKNVQIILTSSISGKGLKEFTQSMSQIITKAKNTKIQDSWSS